MLVLVLDLSYFSFSNPTRHTYLNTKPCALIRAGVSKCGALFEKLLRGPTHAPPQKFLRTTEWHSVAGAQPALHFGGGNFHEISFVDVIVLIQPWHNFFTNGHINHKKNKKGLNDIYGRLIDLQRQISKLFYFNLLDLSNFLMHL